MRLPLFVFSALAVATPVMAQVTPAPPALNPLVSSPAFQAQQFELRQQQEAMRQQLIQQQNQMMTLEAQIRTQQALSDVRAQVQTPRLPLPDVTPGHPLPQIDTSQLASIPDAALADSNRKVLDAANGRR